MSWREWNRKVPMQFDGGDLELDISTPRKLKRHNMLLIGREFFPGSYLMTSGERWPGKTNGALFSFPISALFGFAAGAPELGWWLYSGALPADLNTYARARRASGSLDLSGPRSIAGPFERLRAELQAKEKDFRISCTRRPVYYNPDTEI